MRPAKGSSFLDCAFEVLRRQVCDLVASRRRSEAPLVLGISIPCRLGLPEWTEAPLVLRCRSMRGPPWPIDCRSTRWSRRGPAALPGSGRAFGFVSARRNDTTTLPPLGSGGNLWYVAQSLPVPPPGFDALSVDEKIDYVESLWDAVLDHSEVPVPDWHRELVQERLEAYRREPSAARPWSEIRAELLQKYSTKT